MAVSALSRALRSLALSPLGSMAAESSRPTSLSSQVSSTVVKQAAGWRLCSSPACSRPLLALPRPPLQTLTGLSWRGLQTSAALAQNRTLWKQRTKYTVRPIGMKKTGGRDHTGKIRRHGIGGGHKQRYRIVDFQRLRFEPGKEGQTFEEKVIEVRYDPCRSADIAMVAGGSRKRWIIATENMQTGDVIKTSGVIGRMAVSANEGDSYALGALPVGTLVNNLEIYPGKGAQYIRAAGTCGVLLRKVNGTAIVQLPSKRQIQVLETCMATVGRVSNINHNRRIIGKAGRNRWLGIRPSSGLWKRKGGWAGRKIKPLPPMKSYVNLAPVAAVS
nr:PREDICTED: 39S ribosomal protein L2, mitochondrial isoform X1 [Lepisosteus oculatus]